MAVKLFIVSVFAVLLLPHCSKSAKQGQTPEADLVNIKEEFKDAAPDSEFDNIAVFIPATKDTLAFWRSLSGELTEEFNIRTLVTNQETGPADIAAHMKLTKPVAVVLVDNSTVRTFKAYQDKHKSDRTPAFIFMTSFLKQIIGRLDNANGIAYEVPGVLSMVRARSILKTDVVKIGAVHRKAFTKYVKAQAKMMKGEKFKMHTIAMKDDFSASDLQDALTTLRVKHEVDAIWILNDNALLKPELVSNGWLPVLHKSPLPAIVNVEVLLNPDVVFGTIAVVPDTAALGVQAATMIYNAYDMDWELEKNYVELPLSILTYIDTNNAQDNFGLQENAADFIDKQL